MAFKKYCDFCEREITDIVGTVYVAIIEEYDDCGYLARKEYDMCNNCHSKFKEWKDERKNVNN